LLLWETGSRQVPVTVAASTSSTQSTTLRNAESEQIIEGAEDTETGKMADIVASDTTIASKKSASGRLISTRVCTMTTKLQSQNVPPGMPKNKDHHRVASQEVESLRGYDLAERLARSYFPSVLMGPVADYEIGVLLHFVKVVGIMTCETRIVLLAGDKIRQRRRIDSKHR
jgi:hypothetical protein